MPDVRETYERNIEGLNDLYVKYENDIKKTLKELMDAEKYQEFSALLNEKLNTAILEFEKRNKSVKDILLTKLQLSFNVKEQGIVAEWEKAIINAKSKIEMLGNSLKELINKRITAQIGIPAIEKFLLDAAKRKAFTRITYDFVAKRLNVPANKVGEIAENLIFDGKHHFFGRNAIRSATSRYNYSCIPSFTTANKKISRESHTPTNKA
jgi:hypothetical protein